MTDFPKDEMPAYLGMSENVPVFGPTTRNLWVPFEQPAARPIELPPGTVIGFTKRYTEDGPGYSFAAIHVDRLGWYLTGPKYSGQPVDWETLLDFIGGLDEWAHVGVVTGWTPMIGSPDADGHPR